MNIGFWHPILPPNLESPNINNKLLLATDGSREESDDLCQVRFYAGTLTVDNNKD